MQMQRKQQQLLGSMHLIIRTWHQEVEDWCRLSMMEGHTVIEMVAHGGLVLDEGP
jgi:hypothetical protein